MVVDFGSFLDEEEFLKQMQDLKTTRGDEMTVFEIDLAGKEIAFHKLKDLVGEKMEADDEKEFPIHFDQCFYDMAVAVASLHYTQI